MPADHSLSQTPTAHHGDASAPYPCSARNAPPIGPGFINYGYCRTSLDWHGRGSPQGQGDPRCPASCPNKAPEKVAVEFGRRYERDGNLAAAAWAEGQRKTLPAHSNLRSKVARAILLALAEGDHTRAGLEVATGCRGVKSQLPVLRKAGRIHIVRWEDHGNVRKSPVYRLGAGEDAPEPPAVGAWAL